VDFYLARPADQAAFIDPEVADRVAPIGRVALAEVLAAPPSGGAAIPADTDPSLASGIGAAPAEAMAEPMAEPAPEAAVEQSSELTLESGAMEPASIESPTDEVIADDAVSETGSTGQASLPEAPAESVSAESANETIETPSAALAGDGAVASEPARPSPNGPAQGYPTTPPGFMPMPGQAYAPAYPQYRVPSADPRQVPGAAPWYGPYQPYQPYRPYQPYPAPQYQRPGGSAPIYPAPQGGVR
jgi:hypothetical protein